ncbi:MAG: putative transporter permease protein yphD [Conexibacter sp.]|nr:putative transporter permease protein yphD [Conexibacter sp.]
MMSIEQRAADGPAAGGVAADVPPVPETTVPPQRRLAQAGGFAAAIVVILVIGRLAAPEFVAGDNLLTILRAASITAIVALGMTFLTISGNFFSLSVAQTAVLGSVVYAAVASTGAGFPGALAAVIVVCVVLGAIQGGVVGLGGNPVVVTLAAGAAITGFVLLATDSKRVLLKAPADSLTAQIGRSSPLGVPSATWAFAIVAILCILLLERTTLGRRTILVGANRAAAVASGMNVGLVIVTAFVISALTAGLAGVLTTAEFGVADSAQFGGLDIDAIAAVLVGGTSIKGGEGSVTRTCIGALFIAALRNFLQVEGLSTGWQLTFVGAAVVVAVCVYGLMKRSER